jgi:hypothetical protein
MAYTITKSPDGDLSLGNLRGELVTLQPAPSDYVAGGYLIQGIGGATESTGNVGLDKVLFVDPCGGSGSGGNASNSKAYVPQWNSSTSKLQVFEPSGTGPMVEVAGGTDLEAYSFLLLIGGL